MFLSIENPIITEDSTFLERLGLGGETLLIGMIIVFAMLFVIYLALLAIRAILANKKDTAQSPAESEAPSAAAPQAQAAPVPASPAADDRALIAAITAAIAAYTGEAPTSFRVVAFKKRSSR